MQSPAAPPTSTPAGTAASDPIELASTLAREVAASTERERALPPALLDALCATGLMRAGAPSALGALEAAPAVDAEWR